MGASVGAFAVISTMVTAVAIGQTFLFGGRYPRAASIWVGGCFFPLQCIAVRLWLYSAHGDGLFLSPVEFIEGCVGPMLFSIPIGAIFGYLYGGVIGGVFLILDALAEWRSRRDAVEDAEPSEPTEVVQGEENHETNQRQRGSSGQGARPG
jgi:hypothetical protein